MALLVVFIAALVAWLAAGVGALLGLAMTPEPGYDAVVVALKGLLVAGWLGTLAWLGREMGRGSFGMVAAPIGAWIWVYLVGALLGTVAYLNVGY